MIQNVERWRRWEDEFIASSKPDLLRNLRLMDWMYEEARQLGAWPPFSPEELDAKIEWVKRLHVPTTPR